MPKNNDYYLLHYVDAVEQKLQIKSTKVRYENMTTECLETASQMLIYILHGH